MVRDYDLHLEKRELQKRLLPLVKARRIVALAGPNILTYAKMYSERAKYFEIWENDPQTMLKQLKILRSISGRKINYHFGDIIGARINKSAFYDLDFCNIIRTVVPHIQHFKDCAFMLTVSLRRCSLRETRDIFLSAVGENFIEERRYPWYTFMKTDRNTYLYVTYSDLSPMVTIFKFH